MIFRRWRQASGTDPRGKEAPPAPATAPRRAPLPAGLRRNDGGPRTGPVGPSWARRWLGKALMLAALALGLHAGWLPAKAVLAQCLLQTSWSQGVADGEAHRPWPWADTHPVARLVQPRLGIDQIVLAGDSGRPLAFGPGWAEASARPGSAHGTTIISGHRDTHFAWLRELRSGDALQLESALGRRDYRVASRQVVDSRTHRIAAAGDDALVLVTCWPFDASAPRGPLRYVVTLVDAGPRRKPR